MRKYQIASDDTQIYIALFPNYFLCQCIDRINTCMCQNFLQLNKEKTEVTAFGNKDKILKVNVVTDSRGLTTKKIKSRILV